MSIWQKLFGTHTTQNSYKNHLASVESSCLCKTNEQLIQALKSAHSDCKIKGIKRVLMSRGFTRREIDGIQHTVH